MEAGFLVQLLAQFGALGLLATLTWQLPQFIKMMREWRESSDKNHAEERKEWKAERLELLAAYREESKTDRQEARAWLESQKK